MDGRIKIGTLSGITAAAAVIALVVGVLPVLATNDSQHSTLEIHPTVVSYGGGSGACSSSLDGRGPSAAGKEFHINNPMPGAVHTQDGIKITVSADGTTFMFNRESGSFVVYDVIVNGGPKNTHYDYDDHQDFDGDLPPGTVTSDGNLHAPPKGSGYHNLSHINLCYDDPGKVILICDSAKTIFGSGTFTEATALVLSVEDESGNAVEPCLKDGIFTINPNSVTLDFGDGDGTVTGRLDITKNFGSPPFVDLQYDGDLDPLTDKVDVPWCGITGATAQGDFPELAPNQYPALPTGHTACKVSEQENAAGIQHNVIYFEFDDPNFF